MTGNAFLSQVIHLVKQAQKSKSKTQNLADTAAMWLTLMALVSGALTFLVWLLFMDRELAFAIERAAMVIMQCNEPVAVHRHRYRGRQITLLP
ncbi:hypothetical protein [Rhodoferax sp. UBA5149]|uniref:P-type ATPase n=1 Tax=Rhodoferax sp. UBA5149 TaxID=1947379 RepID=UPI0025CC160A|nr:hypothetical protein [Rhodoferax sp. UBA5149]